MTLANALSVLGLLVRKELKWNLNADYSNFTEYSSPLFHPKNKPRLIERRGMPLQMRVSNGSVAGFPANNQTKYAKNIPGSTIMAPIMRVRNTRIYRC